MSVTQRYVREIAWGALALFVIVAAVIGVMFVYKVNQRYQRQADARNRVKVTRTEVKRTKELVAVEREKANVRRVEADGIRDAQAKIAGTLTDRYLQHEAIRAQEKMAGSPNHTQVYIPSGQNGLPLVATAPEPSKP